MTENQQTAAPKTLGDTLTIAGKLLLISLFYFCLVPFTLVSAVILMFLSGHGFPRIGQRMFLTMVTIPLSMLTFCLTPLLLLKDLNKLIYQLLDNVIKFYVPFENIAPKFF